jgi:hypothetical protein
LVSNETVADLPENRVEPRRPPGARQLLPLLLIAPAVTAPVWWLDRTPLVGFWTAIIAASAAGGVLGIPVLYWALDHGRTGARWLAPLGALAASLFPVVLLAGGVAGQARIGSWRYLRRVLRRGAPLPGTGQIPWSTYAELVVMCIVIGAACGIVYALLLSGQKRRRIAS